MRVGYQGHLVKSANLGVGNCILHLAGALARTRKASEIVFYVGPTEPWQREVAPLDETARVRLAVMPAWTRWRPQRILWEQLALPRRALADGLDLLHATGYVMPIALRLPAVLTVYDLLAITHPALCKPATRWHYRFLLPASLRRARRIIVPSRAVRDALCTRYRIAEDRVAVVVPGVHERFHRQPLPEALTDLSRRYGLPPRFVLFAGGLEPKKNLPRLVAAFHQARRAGLEGELILVGGRGWGTRLARSSPAAGVRWLGHVPAADLALLYRLASELAFPSLAEGFGLPVVEAMASGTVVVASDVPAVEETDPEAVVRIDPLVTTSIAEGLLLARRDPHLRRRLVERGRRAVARFTWDRAAQRTWKIYREVAGG